MNFTCLKFWVTLWELESWSQSTHQYAKVCQNTPKCPKEHQSMLTLKRKNLHLIPVSDFNDCTKRKFWNMRSIICEVQTLQMKRAQVLVCKIALEWDLESQSQVTLPICLLFKSTFACASTHVWKRKNGCSAKVYCTLIVFLRLLISSWSSWLLE